MCVFAVFCSAIPVCFNQNTVVNQNSNPLFVLSSACPHHIDQFDAVYDDYFRISDISYLVAAFGDMTTANQLGIGNYCNSVCR
jgi:hypothetical protein